jgi:hypothetical protein
LLTKGPAFSNQKSLEKKGKKKRNQWWRFSPTATMASKTETISEGERQFVHGLLMEKQDRK